MALRINPQFQRSYCSLGARWFWTAAVVFLTGGGSKRNAGKPGTLMFQTALQQLEREIDTVEGVYAQLQSSAKQRG